MKHEVLWALVVTGLFAANAQSAEKLVFDASKYSQKVTGCDSLAGHSDDPDKVVPGLQKPQMDIAAAIGACQVAVARDPKNPRLNYQLGRAYGYSGQGEKAGPYREIALAADYPQALFVYGYMHLTGMNKSTKDPCLGGELMRRAALYGRMAGQIGFPLFWLKGTFEGCRVKQDPQEMLEFLNAAAEQTNHSDQETFYQKTAIELLQEKMKSRLAVKAK